MKGPSAGALFLLLVALITAGCQRNDARLAALAREAADRQAEQNKDMAQLTHEVAEGSNRLVTADAKARQEVIAVHRELQAERGKLGESYSELETERKQIAAQRRTESMVVPAVEALGAVFVVVSVIAFCWVLLFGLRKCEVTEAELAELFHQELAKTEQLPQSQKTDSSDNSRQIPKRIARPT